ncbi:MAG: VWA domain-containing protein [Pyrinomonadaceae bacterium]
MKRIERIIIAIFFVATSLAAVSASDQQNDISFNPNRNGSSDTSQAIQAQDEERVTVGTNLVSVNVSVTAQGGKSVKGLTRDQFEVFDDNVRQRIAFFSAEDAPSTIGIVYDMHPSTMERTQATLRALKQFVQTLRAEDNFFIVAFNERGSLILDFIPTLDQVQTNLPLGPPKGPTSLYDAVYLAAGKIHASTHPKRALLIISDGQDHNSQRSYTEVRNRVRGFDVQIYSISLDNPASDITGMNTDRWVFEDVTGRMGRRALLMNTEAGLGQAVLAELAKVSGGTAYVPEARSDRELIGICTQIALELRQQYAIGFYPTDAKASAKWHRLRIRVRPLDRSQGSMTLSYREGYQLPVQRR